MYHEEKMINGILCWRGTPNGEFIQYTLEQMTAKYTEMKELGRDLSNIIYDLKKEVEETKG
jgi:hypothetical protein